MLQGGTPNKTQDLTLSIPYNVATAGLNERKLNDEEIQSMSGQLSDDEMTKAVRSLKTKSALGLDGTPASFLINNCNILAVLLRKTFNRHLEQGQLPPEYCTARMKLIPKKGDCTSIKIGDQSPY